ncbi:hypothetical protein H9L39_14234 [Fusarium oxysporum f. sp. albedinis]|nr:hypothetical protein H9L39_14234 [Fusarium oxysporum f. sp. albedinis]
MGHSAGSFYHCTKLFPLRSIRRFWSKEFSFHHSGAVCLFGALKYRVRQLPEHNRNVHTLDDTATVIGLSNQCDLSFSLELSSLDDDLLIIEIPVQHCMILGSRTSTCQSRAERSSQLLGRSRSLSKKLEPHCFDGKNILLV